MGYRFDSNFFTELSKDFRLLARAPEVAAGVAGSFKKIAFVLSFFLGNFAYFERIKIPMLMKSIQKETESFAKYKNAG